MALAEAILGAVTAISQTVSTFVGAGAQRFGMAKNIEAEGVSISRQKNLTAYKGIGDSQKIVLGLVVVIVIVAIATKMYRK